MAISKRMLAHTITVKRLIDDGGMRTKQQTLLSGVAATIVPMDRTTAMANGFTPYKAFDMFTNERNIKTSDVVLEGSRKFVVKSPNPYDGFGGVDHAHYILELAA